MHTTDSDDGSLRQPEIIHRYSRAQMIAEAELMDVSEAARMAGFLVRWP